MIFCHWQEELQNNCFDLLYKPVNDELLLVYYDSQTSAMGRVDSSHQMPRLKPLEEKWAEQQMARVDWLDRLVFREIEQINHKEKSTGDFLHLMVETQLGWSKC